MAGRKPGSKNKEYTNRTGQITLKIDPEIKKRWKGHCSLVGVTMSRNLEVVLTDYLDKCDNIRKDIFVLCNCKRLEKSRDDQCLCTSE